MMSDSASPSAACGSVPAGYGEALRWNISQLGSRIALVQTYAGILFIVGLVVYLMVAAGLGRINGKAAADIADFPYRMGLEIGRQFEEDPSGSLGRLAGQGVGGILLFVGGIFVLQMLIVLLHEGMHGAAMRLFGAHPVFGFIPKQILFYATSPGFAYTRSQYFWVGLAPLISLDVLFFLILFFPIGAVGSVIAAVLGALNTGGAVGDLWILAVLRKFPHNAYVVDEKDGIRIFLPVDETAQD
jgi:hypothetical protein